MKNFNLLVSTSRFNEINSKAELWFVLLICGDDYPIISKLEYSGLIAGLTDLDQKEVILKIKSVLKEDPLFFQYILKVVPIDFVCETNVKVINEIVQKYYSEFISEEESFRIVINNRDHELERDRFINIVAKGINNKVDLSNPDKIIRFEILGKICGISFLENDGIISVKNSYNTG